MIKAKSVFKCNVTPPVGTYKGLWSGYNVRFITPEGAYEAKMLTGIRGLNIPCKVEVTMSDVLVSTGS